MLAILKTYRSNSACSVPPRYLGHECEVVQVDPKLGLTTVSLFDHDKYRYVELVVDTECVEAA